MPQSFKPAGLPADERERLAALQAYAILDTDPEEAFDALTQMAASIFGTPIALVSLVDSRRQWFKSKVGFNTPETPRDLSFCAHAILGEDVLVVQDAREDLRFAGNPLVTEPPCIRFYAGAPMRSPGGHNLGTFCILDRRPGDLDRSERTILRSLARMAVDEMELRLTSARLREELRRNQRAEISVEKASANLESTRYDMMLQRAAQGMNAALAFPTLFSIRGL